MACEGATPAVRSQGHGQPLRAIAACLPLYFVLAAALMGVNGMSLGFGMALIFATLGAFFVAVLLYLEWVPLVPGQIHNYKSGDEAS